MLICPRPPPKQQNPEEWCVIPWPSPGLALPGQQSSRIFHRSPAPTSRTFFLLIRSTLNPISLHLAICTSRENQNSRTIPITPRPFISHSYFLSPIQNGRHNTRAAPRGSPNQHPPGQRQCQRRQDRSQVYGSLINGAASPDAAG